MLVDQLGHCKTKQKKYNTKCDQLGYCGDCFQLEKMCLQLKQILVYFLMLVLSFRGPILQISCVIVKVYNGLQQVLTFALLFAESKPCMAGDIPTLCTIFFFFYRFVRKHSHRYLYDYHNPIGIYRRCHFVLLRDVSIWSINESASLFYL